MAPAAVALPKNYGQKGYVKVYRGDELLVTELVMVSITLIIVALRLFTRVYILGAMHSDDWWIILATSVLVALTAVHGVGVKYGIGRHSYDISTEATNIALTMAYVGQILYVVSLACVKISLLLFLQRIFPTVVVRRVLRGLLIFVLCFSVTNVFLFAFQCDTPEFYFSKVRGATDARGGVCLEPQVVNYPMAAINTLTDVIIWLLPVPMIVKARLARVEKQGLVWVFLLGGVAVGASIVRPVYLRDIMKDGDPTWKLVNVSVWAMIETSVGILCTSIPVIKPLAIKVAPRLLTPAGDRSHNHHGGAANSHPADASNARRNSFALRSIKVTHDIHQVEDDVADTGSIGFGLQQPSVTLGFHCEKQRTSGGSSASDEQLVIRSETVSSEAMEKNPASPP